MIILLFSASFILAVYSYKRMTLKLLSPTFWASLMFTVYSAIYIFTFKTMLSDISIITVLVVVSFLMTTLLGEKIATYKNHRSKLGLCIDDKQLKPIKISKIAIILLTVMFTVVSIERFINLVNFTISHGYSGSMNIFDLLAAARIAYVDANAQIVLGNVVFNQLVYVSEITTYICIFVFMHNYMICKVKHYYLLLPLIPDFALRLITTSRSAFITLIFAVIVIYILIRQIQKKNPLRLSWQMLLLLAVFVILFVWYGFRRNSVSNISLITYLQMYTCSSLYNFDWFLRNGLGDNPYFGFYTLQEIFKLFRIDHDVVPSWLPFVVFGTDGARSNIFTSLLDVTQDFGVIGMLLIRFIEAFIAGKIVNYFSEYRINKRMFYVSIYFVVSIMQCYLWSATGDSFPGVYASPDLMLRYLIYGYILVVISVKPYRGKNASLCVRQNYYNGCKNKGRTVAK